MSEPISVAAIVGATAVGKTAISQQVAETLGAEIVSIDSMQIYKGMDIGTDKPPPDALRRIPHHLVSIADPAGEVSVAEFQRLARSAVDDIARRKKLPLLVGGSGLYFRAVVDDLHFPPRSQEVRAGLEAEIDDEGSEALHERLRAVDPKAAAKIKPGNARRIVRAFEVIELTGKPFSDNTSWEKYESVYALNVVGLKRERDELYKRIADRVGSMLDEGLVTETKELVAGGMARTARQALGYRQVLDRLDDGDVEVADRDELREAIVRATKRFARRQESWFGVDPRITWMDASAPDIADRVAAHLRHGRLP